jgi:hypothetical protein
MAATYVLISSQVLGSSASSVTFSSIPSTYNDLKLVMSHAQSGSGNFATKVNFNGDSGTNYSYTSLRGNGSSASSAANTSNTTSNIYYTNIGSDTANAFDSMELYIPNYTSTSTKQFLSFGAEETNSATANMALAANLYQGTSAISSIVIASSSGSFITNSSFYLYGIKNA